MDRTGIGLLLVCLLCVSPCVLGQGMVNVALGKTYRQSTTLGAQDRPSYAANGNTNGTYHDYANRVVINCIHTGDSSGTYWSDGKWKYDRNPWWEVDLGRTYPVQDITVWARTNFISRLYPFTITVDGQPCVRVVDDGKRERSVRCGSVMYGQVVRLTKDYTANQNNQYLNLCELEVLVPSGVSQCPAGRYGQGCGQTCSSSCGGGPGNNFCNYTSGVCYDGCVENFTGNRCQDCTEGNYGPTCGGTCYSLCAGGCAKVTGYCTRCVDRRWGPQFCQQPCPVNCNGNSCQRDDGHCYGCVGNFAGATCTDCKPGFYGNQCDTPCGRITPGCALCTQQGVCTRCRTGYNGLPCTDCAPGYYKSGDQCAQCPANCRNSRCYDNTGKCDGCPDGWWGDQCVPRCYGSCGQCTQDTGNCTACSGFLKLPDCKECLEGYYKQSSSSTWCTKCTWQCVDNTVCSNTTGDCADCPPGKTGNRCEQDCSPGRYGPSRCAETCGQCKGGPCDVVNGHCAQCQPGWQAPLCKTPCAPNTYGENCSESCGRCKGEQPCNTTTGKCTGECQPGYTGTLCKTECEAGLYGAKCNQTCGNCQVNTTCHHEDGHCLVGCVAEFAGPLCLQDATPATSQESKDDGATNLVGPLVGAIVGVGLVMTISITAAICWRRKSNTSRSSGQDPPTASPVSVKDSAPTASPEPSSQRQSSSNEDNPYSEIRDPNDIYEITEMQSIYDKPSPYSNDDGDREPYMQLTPKTNDVHMPASNAAYVNTKLSV